MAVQLSIPYETLVTLVDQLPDQERSRLLNHLLKRAKTRHLTPDEKKAILRSMVSDAAIGPGYSDRREDWYDDDGR